MLVTGPGCHYYALIWGTNGYPGGEAEWALGPRGPTGHRPPFVFPRPGQYVPELGATSEDARLGLGVSPGKGGRAAAGCDLCRPATGAP